jgi:hypothetical protein
MMAYSKTAWTGDIVVSRAIACPHDDHDGCELHGGETVSRSNMPSEYQYPPTSDHRFSETSPERASATPLVASKKIILADGAWASLVAVW